MLDARRVSGIQHSAKIFSKKFSPPSSLVIGFKRENSVSSGEDGQAVKLELWVVERGRAAFALRVILAAFNEAQAPLISVLKKAQGARANPPIHSDRFEK